MTDFLITATLIVCIGLVLVGIAMLGFAIWENSKFYRRARDSQRRINRIWKGDDKDGTSSR